MFRIEGAIRFRCIMKELQYNKDEIKRAVKILGSVMKLARALEVGELSVYRWTSGKSAPDPINCLKIQKLTNGQVKAKDIRPDYEWDKVI